MVCGGLTWGWKAAYGGGAIAHEFAVGGGATAAHANDASARAFIQGSHFFQVADALIKTWIWPSTVASTLPLVLYGVIVLNSRMAKKKRDVELKNREC